ncbi:hypothetical protein ACWGA9_06130 [Streptomyces sp. NPDC054950]
MPKKNDATGEPLSVEFNGDTYLVPPADDWDLDVLEAIDDQRMTHALKSLIGDEQYAMFRKSNRKVSDLGKFFETAGKQAGTGNS